MITWDQLMGLTYHLIVLITHKKQDVRQPRGHIRQNLACMRATWSSEEWLSIRIIICTGLPVYFCVRDVQCKYTDSSRNRTGNVANRGTRETTVAVEKQCYIFSCVYVCVFERARVWGASPGGCVCACLLACDLAYPLCKANASYIVTCSFVCTKFLNIIS